MNSIDNPILNKLYRGTKSIGDFNWDNLTSIPLLYLISREEIDILRKIITSPRYSGNSKLRMQKIREIMSNRGFEYFAGGTNRLVFTHPMAPNAVFKVAIDAVGITDNPAEFYNQELLKPYCCKIFECSPCGTIASVERVDKISNYDEFLDILPDYMALIGKFISGKYIMEDIGIDYFMNFGIRRGNSIGSGLVLLDFPYLFELDGRKLVCGIKLENGAICNGEIDWHPTFNYLHCEKCGRIIKARELAKKPEDSGILIKEGGSRRMKITIKRGNVVEKVVDTNKISTHFVKEDIDNTQISNRTKLVVKPHRVVVEDNTLVNATAPVMKTDVVNTNDVIDKTIKEEPKIVRVKVTIGDAAQRNTVDTTKPVVKTVKDERVVKPNNNEETVDTSNALGIITETAHVFDPKDFNTSDKKNEDDIDEDVDEITAAKYLENEKRTNYLATNVTNAIFGKDEDKKSESGKDIKVPGKVVELLKDGEEKLSSKEDKSKKELNLLDDGTSAKSELRNPIDVTLHVDSVKKHVPKIDLEEVSEDIDEPKKSEKKTTTTTRKVNHKRPSTSTKGIKSTRTKKTTSEEDISTILKPKKKSEV